MVAVLRRCRCARLLSRLFSGRCLWPHGCSGRRRILLRGRAAVCAGGRRPAREIATREPAARSGRSRGPPWPRRRPPAPRPGPASGDSPVPSGPSGVLHTSGAVSLGVARPGPAAALRHRGLALQSLRRPPYQWGWLGALACCLARSCCLLSASRGSRVLSFWGGLVRVVTNVVNRRCFSCGFLIRCYKRRQSDGFFAENQCFWTQIDDVCNMSTRKGVQIASV